MIIPILGHGRLGSGRQGALGLPWRQEDMVLVTCSWKGSSVVDASGVCLIDLNSLEVLMASTRSAIHLLSSWLFVKVHHGR